jgi:hypothetical protein
MKRIFTIASLLLLFVACQKEEMPSVEVRDCLVTINTVGDISISESDLTRGSASLNDLYAVQVYKNGSRFASGIFDDVSKMQLNLKTGSTYDIRMCMVRDAKSLLKNYFSLTNNGIQWGNGQIGPFYCNYNNTSHYVQTNRFFYNSNGYFNYYSDSSSTSLSQRNIDYFELINIRNGRILDTAYPNCTDWFYGEVNKYAPNGEVATLDLELKRVGFRLKYELSGVTDGEVTVKVYNNERTFINNTTNTSSYESEEQFIAFYDTYSAWLYADNYTENMTVAVTWKRGIGVTQDLGTKTIQVKRNCLNNIRITLSSDDKGAGVSLNTEDDSSMGSTDTTIPLG